MEMNKIFGAILGTLLFVMGVGFLAEAIYAPIEGRGVGYALPEPTGEESTDVAEVEMVPLPVLLASANAEDGARVARKCSSCHNFEEGSANKTGPELYDIVGRQIASVPGFAYSDALAGMGAEGQAWDYESLNHFLESPKGFAPGTKMTFAGLRSEQERADILAYMQTLSASPVPFPEPEVEDMAAEEAGDAASEDAVIVPEGEDVTEAVEPVETDTAVEAETDTDGNVEDSNPAVEESSGN